MGAKTGKLFAMVKKYPVFFLLFPLAAASLASAAVIDWGGAAAGDFSDPLDWVGPAAPGASDTANFASAGAVSVTLSESVTIDDLTYNMTTDSGPPVVAPQLTINLNGFQLSSGLANTNTFSVGNSGPDERTLTVLGNGTFNINHRLVVYEFRIGATANLAPSGFKLVLDDAAVIRGNRNAGHRLGEGDSQVAVEVLGGSRFDLTGQTVIAGGADSATTILVSGANSTFMNSNSGSIRYHTFGTSGSAVMTIEDGGRYESNAFSSLGLGATGNGEIHMTGSGTTLQMARGLYVAGGLTLDSGGPPTAPFLGIAGGAGTVSLADNAVVTLGGPVGPGEFRQGFLHVMAADPAADRFGQVILDGTATLNADLARFEEGSILRIGLRDTAQAANLIVVEDLTLNDATLEAWLPTGLTPQAGQSFALVEYGELFGMFANPDGEVVIGEYHFQIDYSLDGADVIGLTFIPEPGIAVLALGCAALLVALRRRSGC